MLCCLLRNSSDHQSIVIQGNLIGVFSSGLLAESPAILDSFFTNTTSDFIGVVGWGVGEPRSGKEKHTSSSHTAIWIHWCSRQPKNQAIQWITSLASRVATYSLVAFH